MWQSGRSMGEGLTRMEGEGCGLSPPPNREHYGLDGVETVLELGTVDKGIGPLMSGKYEVSNLCRPRQGSDVQEEVSL